MSSTERNSISILPSRSLLFLSDVHLGGWSADKNRILEEQLIRLVDFCRENALEIVILGDFFDYWMEYPAGKVPPLGDRILEHFHRYHIRTGSHTLFVTGNHDNWTNGYLVDLGFDLEHEYRIIQDAETSIMVLHGDGLRDPAMGLPRPRMHRILRNAYFIKMYQTLLPPRLGWFGMRLFSRLSRTTGDAAPHSDGRAMLDEWAISKVLADDRIQAVVYGHHHRPVLWKQQGLTCMNCGSFGSDYSLGLYANKAFETVTWDAGSNTLATGYTTADT